MPFARRLTTAFAVLLAGAGSLAAQDVAQAPITTEPQAQAVAPPAAEQAPVAARATEQQPVSLAPFAENAKVGVHANSPSDLPAPYAPPANNHGQSVTLMIVGGAAFVAGLLIGGTGGTVVAVGGVVVGAIGLYKYLQ